MDHCEECGFSYDLSTARQAGPAIRVAVEEMADILRNAKDLAIRTRPDVWSPLEYACHVRDVLLVQRERALSARRIENPSCPPMGRDERVDHDGYAEQTPEDVARQATDAAQLFTNVLDRLGDSDWARSLVYNFPEPTERSLEWLAVHTLHEVRHHLRDIRGQLA
ncbi:hypothetical protein JOF56_005538 [Kibdelosporangium banguiense]|uniref:DinB-like domain-containing protein n=1 Tax=Kibdelosporangium banguiense TaxID=1365924 RepID=A0ABS4TL57_9PSEU|nr:DinB family protein [Kibdelosporangium banguiense]MBP2325153.1 hypothetical protein [Kibdelosporangium banguiense]